jgi:UDP-N-acetylmuramoyl-tripeptide--D-alanyl-D-alanine ligase
MKIRFQISKALRNGSLDLVVWMVSLYRRLILNRVIFIGVTGSCGKTSTKELISTILSTRYKGQKNEGTSNITRDMIRNILRVRITDTYCVHEVAISESHGRLILPGEVKMLRPKIGVVTNIETDHVSAFGSKQGIFEEKSKLIAALPKDGIAILNADDPLVSAMSARCAGRVITYGTGPSAMVRAKDISCAWPERLAFTVQYGEETHFVQTQFCGAYWVHCVLAALTAGLCVGIPLKAGIDAVKAAQPFPGRLSPVYLPAGVTIIRDDIKAPLWSFPAALEFMRQAKAARKIVIIGNISDYKGTTKPKYLEVARSAVAVSDYVLFVGRQSAHSLHAKKHAQDDSIQAFATVDQLAAHLKGFLKPDDLVLIKGSMADNLKSLIGRLKSGDKAIAPNVVITPDTLPIAAETESNGFGEATTAASPTAGIPPHDTQQLVVGLGNPQKRLANTRHNIGYRVVDELARRLGAQWKKQDQAIVASTEFQNRPIFLVKLLSEMNNSGRQLQKLREQFALRPEGCILIQDAMDLPVGKIRERMKGSAGGHNGVLSILTAFQTEEFRRVKVGIGQPKQKGQESSFVLSDFSSAEQPLINAAVEEAARRVEKLLAAGRIG